MADQIRRVVTAHNKEGKSIIFSDGIAENAQEMTGMTGLIVTDLWETIKMPVDNLGVEDTVARPIRHEPPPKGTLFRTVEFPPDKDWKDNADAQKAFDSIGGGHTRDQSSDDPLMHKSDTIDYIIILRGEIYAVMEEGETLLREGDVMIQRGTKHSWHNRSDSPCLLAAILIDSHPI